MLLVGLCTVDLVQRVTELPSPGQKAQSLVADLAAGGPAANAAVAVAATGGDPTLVTALGQHPLAALARADLEQQGVRVVDLSPEHAAAPPVSAVMVRESDGERTVVSRNSAEIPAHPDDVIPDLVARSAAVLVDGHHPEIALATAREARRQGVPVVLDAGSWKPVLNELLPLVDVCACSSAFTVPGPTRFSAAVHGFGVPVLIRTAGPEPVTWSCVYGHAPDGTPLVVGGQVPVAPVPARDTLGAGDVWHGVFALGVACLGRTPGPAELPGLVGAANDVAGLRVQHVGPRAWVQPVREQGRGGE
ncbi:PfkB family carbohydrate kinase [Longimycelium tulufanense]|uniref:PfkB family carbohydrate kinase n=1 Tax=Longimycelium tulufanense TaxID=907463 RepID=UPI001664C0CA|nr:PfkB family carbohydrate kinase [Longimycelium tulufanense]